MHQTPDVAQATAALDALLARIEERCRREPRVGVDFLGLRAARGALVVGGWAVARPAGLGDGDEAARLSVPASRVRVALNAQASAGLHAQAETWARAHWRGWAVIHEAVCPHAGAPHLPAPEPAPEPKRRGKAQGKAMAQRRANPSAWKGRY